MAHEHPHQEHEHHHHHAHHVSGNNQQVLWRSLIIISVYMVIEAVGGYVTNSVALLSDAGHMLSDALALGLALMAFKLGQRQANASKSFGYQRFEILAAAFNGLTLIVVALWVVYEAISRFIQPLPIQSTGMLVVAVIGLVVNVVVAWLLFKSGDTHDNLNMRGAFLHVLGDLLGSVAAILAALAVKWYGWTWADPLISILVCLLIFKSAWSILKDAIHVLMEGTPKHINISNIEELLHSQSEITAVHDLHVWSITSGQHALACHLVVDEDLRLSQIQPLLHRLEHLLQDAGITHVTLQTETHAHGHATTSDGCHQLAQHAHEHKHEHESTAH